MSTRPVLDRDPLAPARHQGAADIAHADALTRRTPGSVQRDAHAARLVGGITRIALGWVFLWAFLDKLFGLGRATAGDRGWLDGGSPTDGFLSNAPTGPFAGLYNDIAGAAWADALFMAGLLAIGVALVLGVAMRAGVASGALLLVLMWTAVLPPEQNPFVDDHLVYALVLVLLLLTRAGHTLGLGRAWERLPLVRRVPALR